ncbi:hypothetical protein J6590_039660 [Homalodisca vitripennis]|nr:hypothetical protein J6590_039660 [Homalodisca vitripennis]
MAEKCMKCSADVSATFKDDIRDIDISTAHRLQGRKVDPRPPSIVVYFVSRVVKTSWLAARRKKGSMTVQELGSSFPNTPIYINEHLTPQSRAIFNGARALVKQGKLSTVWNSDSTVMAKLKPDQPSVSETSSISSSKRR